MEPAHWKTKTIRPFQKPLRNSRRKLLTEQEAVRGALRSSLKNRILGGSTRACTRIRCSALAGGYSWQLLSCFCLICPPRNQHKGEYDFIQRRRRGVCRRVGTPRRRSLFHDHSTGFRDRLPYPIIQLRGEDCGAAVAFVVAVALAAAATLTAPATIPGAVVMYAPNSGSLYSKRGSETT